MERTVDAVARLLYSARSQLLKGPCPRRRSVIIIAIIIVRQNDCFVAVSFSLVIVCALLCCSYRLGFCHYCRFGNWCQSRTMLNERPAPLQKKQKTTARRAEKKKNGPPCIKGPIGSCGTFRIKLDEQK